MKFLSLFAGIGGFDLGLERAGMECVGQVEIDEWRLSKLVKHWPNVPKWRDVYEFTGNEIGAIDLICAGYPCQGESGSGKRQGTNDDRWLWPETFRIVKAKWPSWFLGENVINHEGMGLSLVIADLESAGYSVRPFIIPSAACGLPTVERHIWIVAASDEIRLQGDFAESFQWEPELSEEFSRGDPVQYERWALPESRVCRVGERPADWVDRIKAIGDSVPPQVVEVIGRAILRAHIVCAERLPEHCGTSSTSYNSSITPAGKAPASAS